MEIAAHERVVVEDAGSPVLSRKDTALVWKVHTSGIDQVDDGDAAAHGDLLGPEHLLDGLGPPGARLDRGVVRHHHDLAALSPANAGHDTHARRLAFVAIVSDE